MSSQKDVNKVVSLLMEMEGAGPGAPDGDMSPGMDTGDIGAMAGMMDTGGVTPEEDTYDDQFGDAEMKLAKRFIELVGSPERAQELLDKALEGFEYLGMIDDNETDEATIDVVAQAMPDDVGAPSTIAHMVSSFDPSAG